MSEFLANLLSSLGAKLVQGLMAWWDRKKLEAEAKKAEELEERIESIRQNKEREEALREEERKEVRFSYDAWEAQQ